MSITLTRYIALCGHPGSGKSTVQKILSDLYDVRPVDDGLPLRRIAVEQMGLTWNQVLTQAGKLETVEIAGRAWVVRDLLGQIGNRMEDLLGPHGIPFLCEQTVAGETGSFSFGSVRRDQGGYYKAKGGAVIGVRSPFAQPSRYEFDRFDESLVDVWIDNDGVSLEALQREVCEAMWRLDLMTRTARTA
ncbi:hypothetical protein FV222_00140 [Methylobacterium sp. WL103]|uniref:hypothetical protein n=1 Tax=Methylobacterium sp. WL103 TaxID=2603891 RepID=UPI0011C93108|nr:hypothetical protein [Methylobacterium sp. WL103]TXN08915.1 hypothetical protein FV222_00140 [Methylobacterium sp. WL103]